MEEEKQEKITKEQPKYTVYSMSPEDMYREG